MCRGLMAKTSGELMMERETRISYGPVPDRLHDEPLREISWQIAGNDFLFRALGLNYFFYRKGEGITVHRGDDLAGEDESLWLNGTVYAAVASMNGLLPIHASAVAHRGAVYAFTGPAGSGKSTLVAALGALGLPMFCDDTLVLDLSGPDRIVCLPGHKRLKLLPDALELTGATAGERVSPAIEKLYCEAPSGEVGIALPLAELIFLEEGPEAAIAPISGYDRFARMNDDHYTAYLYAGARQFDRAARFEHLSGLATRLQMARFIRPRDAARFHQDVELVAEYLSRRRRG